MVVDVCILGGGLAGLYAAYLLQRLGLKIVIFEREERPGGLLKSINLDGYVFDMGGSHVIFSKNKEVLNQILNLIPGGIIRHYRNSRIYYGGKYIKYPFENSLYQLGPQERYECLRDFINALVRRAKGEFKTPKNFTEWCYQTFGESICNKYLIPYNEKIWKVSTDELSSTWVAGRVPNPPIDDVIKAATGIPTEGYKHQLNFYYPMSGGIESLVRGIIGSFNSNVTLKLRAEVSKVRKENDLYIVKVGSDEYLCKKVISTIPLPELLNRLPHNDIPKELRDLIPKLAYTSLIVVGVGGKPKNPYGVHWIYFPQLEIPFHRLAILSNYSKSMAPKGKISLIAEVSFKPNDRIDVNDLIDQSLDYLDKLGFIRRDDTECVTYKVWRYAYILHNHNYEYARKTLIKFLDNYGIVTLGRFGSWKYLNMDQVILEVSNMLKSKVLSNVEKRSPPTVISRYF